MSSVRVHLVAVATEQGVGHALLVSVSRSSVGFRRRKVVTDLAKGESSLLVLGDVDVPLAGQVDDGGRHLLDVHRFVDERAGQAGWQVGGRLGHVAGVDRLRIVAATAAPQQQHAQQHEDGQREPPPWAR